MSMDESAIKRIQDTAITAQQKLDTHTPSILLPRDFEVKNLEYLADGRTRYRGRMETDNLNDFVEYNTDQDGQKCFINAQNMSALTYFNLGTATDPGHGDHTAKLTLARTAAYRSIVSIDGDDMKQKTAAEWLEDWRDFITPKDTNMANMNMLKAISAVRNLTIKAMHESEHQDSDLSAARNTMDRIEASSKDQLPAGFVFTCVPYNGLAERDFYLRMSVLTSRDDPRIVLRIVRHEKLIEEMAEELKTILGELLPESIDRYIGIFSV